VLSTLVCDSSCLLEANRADREGIPAFPRPFGQRSSRVFDLLRCGCVLSVPRHTLYVCTHIIRVHARASSQPVIQPASRAIIIDWTLSSYRSALICIHRLAERTSVDPRRTEEEEPGLRDPLERFDPLAGKIILSGKGGRNLFVVWKFRNCALRNGNPKRRHPLP
jgi:hypothetical protein